MARRVSLTPRLALDAGDRVMLMARAPKRSGLVGDFFDWAPVRAARSFLGHVGLGLVCMGGIWLSDEAFHWLFPAEPKFFDWIPVKWFFHAGEAGILLTFVIWGIYDAWRELLR